MRETIHAESIKLRTVTAHWVLAIVAIVFPVAITVLATAFGVWPTGNLSRDISILVTGLSVVTTVLLGALSITSLTSEYGNNMIRATFAATPSRRRVHLAKLIVLSAMSAALGLFTSVGAWFVARGVLAGRGLPISLGADGVIPRLSSVGVLAVLITWFGYALGLLIRNGPGAITALLVWPLIVENLLGGVLAVLDARGLSRWMPYTAAIQATVDSGSDFDALGRPWGHVWFGAITLALIALGLVIEQRRDA